MILVTGSRVDAWTVYTAFSDLLSGSSSGIALVMLVGLRGHISGGEKKSFGHESSTVRNQQAHL